MTDPLQELRTERAMSQLRPVQGLLDRCDPGTRRSVLELVELVSSQGLGQPVPIGTVLRDRRSGREAVCICGKPAGYEERTFPVRSRAVAGRPPSGSVRDVALVWTISPEDASPRRSQSPLEDWIVVDRDPGAI